MTPPSDAPEPEDISQSREHWYRQYRGALRSFFARRLRRSATVDEHVQEVFARLLKYQSHEKIEDPLAYIFKVAHRVLFDAKKTREEEDHCVSLGQAELAARVEAVPRLWVEEEGGQAILLEEVRRVLRQLPRPVRVALVRQRRDGWTHRRIAEEMGVSVNTVKDYLARGINHLRIHFSLKAKDEP